MNGQEKCFIEASTQFLLFFRYFYTLSSLVCSIYTTQKLMFSVIILYV